MWLDMTGTAPRGPDARACAGLLVGLANNFCIARVRLYRKLPFLLSGRAAVALIVEPPNMRREGQSLAKRIISTIVLATVVSAVISTLLTPMAHRRHFRIHMGDVLFRHSILMGLAAGPSCFFSTFVIKIYDVLASAAIVTGICAAS